ncbi:hypothetical protein [Marinobacterium sp. BA1]|uniref:hypothetical protein n=1 Tax=Marinobacterium sp. BA1 TaxID=3138931 RepID=UPI0034E8B1CF
MSGKFYQAGDPAVQAIFDRATEGRPVFTTRSECVREPLQSESPTSVWVSSSAVPLSTASSHSPSFDSRVEYVFTAFRAAYGSRFTSARSAQELIDFKQMWQSILKPFEIDEVKRAVQTTITTLHWPPSIIEFLENLQSARAGFTLPSSDQAYHEACSHAASPSRARWTHVAIYHAGRDTGWYRLRSDSSFAVSKAFAHHYNRYVQRVMAGEVLEQPKSSQETPHALDMNVKHQDATQFIREMIDHYSSESAGPLDAAIISEVFFYLTLPSGPVRRSMKSRSEERVQRESLPIPVPLPDTI